MRASVEIPADGMCSTLKDRVNEELLASAKA
jgi:hypothetical protein